MILCDICHQWFCEACHKNDHVWQCSESNPDMQNSKPQTKIIEGREVRPAPDWLVKRMEALRKLPPPTLEQVETSFRASERMREELYKTGWKARRPRRFDLAPRGPLK